MQLRDSVAEGVRVRGMAAMAALQALQRGLLPQSVMLQPLRSTAVSAISGTLARALDNGQSALALAAIF